MKYATWLCALLFCGCGVHPGTNPDPIQIVGSVLHNGKPISDVVLNLQATGAGVQATLPIRNGTFQGNIVPGRYTFFISEGTSAGAFKAIPPKYHQGSLDRQFDIDGKTNALTLTLE